MLGNQQLMTASMTWYIQNDMYYLRLKVIQEKYASTFENDEINLVGTGALVSRSTHSRQLTSQQARNSGPNS
jgi:hypothetical protein